MTQQGNSAIPMGLCLENYSYAYPVNYITLDIQRQVLNLVPASVAQTMGNYPELGRVTAAKIPDCGW
jgi:hypothetical protein